MYKVYYWLTLLLFLLMFVMAAWFVCLVAVNTTGEHGHSTQGLPLCLKVQSIQVVASRTLLCSPSACSASLLQA